MKELGKTEVTTLVIDEDSLGQRVDNFLLRELKGVPKSHVYRLLRTGQVRVNGGRVGADYRLEADDKVRIPPLRRSDRTIQSGHALDRETRAESARATAAGSVSKPTSKLYARKLYEDDGLLAIDKPAGVAVHGGSGVSFGVIEQLRRELPKQKSLELVHRLDKETSGVLLLAKKRSALTALHRALRDGKFAKHYLTLVHGDWREPVRRVRLSLHKYLTAEGERRVSVQSDGRVSETTFRLRQRYTEQSLLEAELLTGRTHQIRVQLAHLGFPILGDDKYGDFALNRALRAQGLKRMFLHAAVLEFPHPTTGSVVKVESPLPAELQAFLERLEKQ